MTTGSLYVPDEETKAIELINHMRELGLLSQFVVKIVKTHGVAFLEEHAKTVMGSYLEEK